MFSGINASKSVVFQSSNHVSGFFFFLQFYKILYLFWVREFSETFISPCMNYLIVFVNIYLLFCVPDTNITGI